MSILTLENEILRVQFGSYGAEMQSLFYKNKNLECLWQANPDYWARHAPVLFPIVGRLANDRLNYLNNDYPMTQHGFARDMEFEVVEKNEQCIKFRLVTNKNTLKQFPFKFELIIEYRLQANCLITTYTIHNPTATPLPASIGAHPAFNWPLSPDIPKTDHQIEFEYNENDPIRQLENGLLLNESFQNPIKNKIIHLEDTLFENDALIFDKIKSRIIRYNANNKIAIKLNFNDFPHLGIWTKPGAPFICLEPWHGHSSPVDFRGDFTQKPGIFIVPEHSDIRKSFEILLE